jgi:hypothetical protein
MTPSLSNHDPSARSTAAMWPATASSARVVPETRPSACCSIYNLIHTPPNHNADSMGG